MALQAEIWSDLLESPNENQDQATTYEESLGHKSSIEVSRSSSEITTAKSKKAVVEQSANFNTLPPELQLRILKAGLVLGKIYPICYYYEEVPVIDLLTISPTLYQEWRLMLYRDNTFVIAEGYADRTTDFIEYMADANHQLIRDVELTFTFSDLSEHQLFQMKMIAQEEMDNAGGLQSFTFEERFKRIHAYARAEYLDQWSHKFGALCSLRLDRLSLNCEDYEIWEIIVRKNPLIDTDTDTQKDIVASDEVTEN
ncbi:MAG: hypothetical protein M1835_001354 [Candelina submexicana]|nr:MAG: hypothetical protein M1835_001354 [Candelina submexicana]